MQHNYGGGFITNKTSHLSKKEITLLHLLFYEEITFTHHGSYHDFNDGRLRFKQGSSYWQNIDSISLAASKGLYDAKIMPKDELTILVQTTDPLL